MKKIIFGLLLILCISTAVFEQSAFAAAINIPGTSNIEEVSANVGFSQNPVESINNLGFDILRIAKLVIMGLMVIYTVYLGAQMIMSMGINEEQLSSAKRQIWYMVVAIVFINIPGTLYEAFRKSGDTTLGYKVTDTNFIQGSETAGQSIFFNMDILGVTIENIILFMQILLAFSAILMITIAGIQIMGSAGKEEGIQKAKGKIFYTLVALLFVGFIEAFKNIVFTGNISQGIDVFNSIINILFFFAAPVAMFFLTLAGYYYITSNGDEERVKKAKNIIINTLLATLILLASFSFLKELIDFKF